MNIFKLFARKHVLFRCNYCNATVKATINRVLRLERRNRHDPVCPLKEECHYCHMGFVIPVHYKSKNGKIYKFDELAPKIPHLDPKTLLERLLDGHDL